MIFDTLKNCAQYYGVHPRFEKAFAFIKQAVAENLPAGKYEIDGKELYASVLEYNTKVEPDGKFEGHKNYIDIQYIVSGAERMEEVHISKATPKTEYNDVKDVTFYEDCDKAGVCIVEAGEYGIFMPDDIHKPSMAVNGISAPVKKIVVKVKL